MKKVYLVGAGPGDPELLTVKGRRLLETADCVLYDHLAAPELLALAPAAAEKLYVGKRPGEHAYGQDEISAMLVERARKGLAVVRLKGGDPFLFGRGGEEAEALAEAGVPFEIVPGVAAPMGVAAYTGVPLTHRDYASAITFVNGHAVDEVDWSSVARAGTIVVFMGLTNLARIAARLIGHGRAPDTPAMAVRWATRPEQQTVSGTLEELAAAAAERGMKPPATVIIGDVVRLRERLDWFSRLPLAGRRIVVTRAREQASAFSARLKELGAEVIELPTIEIRPAADYAALDEAIADLESYDWLLFTSANGVRYFVDRLDRSARDLRCVRARVCAIGPATRAALEALHLKVDLMPQEYIAESLVEAFAGHDLAGKRILLPRAAVARDLVPAELSKRGARVDVVEAYRTVIPEEARERARAIFSGKKPDWVAFTSSSTVMNFLEAAGVAALEGVRVASIGPITSATARRAGLSIAAEAAQFNIDGLVAAIVGEERGASVERLAGRSQKREARSEKE